MVDHTPQHLHRERISTHEGYLFISVPRQVHLLSSRGFDIGASGEEAALPCDDREDCIWMVVEFTKALDDVDHQIATKRVESFGAVELDGADLARDVEKDIGVLVGGHGERLDVNSVLE